MDLIVGAIVVAGALLATAVVVVLIRRGTRSASVAELRAERADVDDTPHADEAARVGETAQAEGVVRNTDIQYRPRRQLVCRTVDVRILVGIEVSDAVDHRLRLVRGRLQDRW